MKRITMRFLGSGDAFGSGGRFQTCFLLQGEEHALLIDCGASSLIAMKRAAVNPSDIGWVALTHLHGDHFAGLPFLILDGQFSRRTNPLTIAGPFGVRERLEAAMEVLFPGSSRVSRRFATGFIELREGTSSQIGSARVTPFSVPHPSGAASYALRIEYGGKVVAYSGDTEWTDALFEAAHGANLFICEAYFFDRKIKHHLDYATLRAHRERLECGRLILTHMSRDMLSREKDSEFECARDGQEVVLE